MSKIFWSSLIISIHQLFDEPESNNPKQEINKIETQSFYTACQTGNLELVNTYLENGTDPSLEYNLAIRFACFYSNNRKNNNLAVIDRLLQDSRVIPAAIGAVFFSISDTNIELVEFILHDSRVNPTINNNEALRMVRSKGFKKVAARLLRDPRVKKLEDDNNRFQRLQISLIQ
jgi:hypothetical protein